MPTTQVDAIERSVHKADQWLHELVASSVRARMARLTLRELGKRLYVSASIACPTPTPLTRRTQASELTRRHGRWLTPSCGACGQDIYAAAAVPAPGAA